MSRFYTIILLIFIAGLVNLFAQAERGVKNIKAERKIALVIGNTNYDNSIGRLTNPVNDAVDVADALKRLNFTLVGGKEQLDVNRKQMLALIREFGQQIKQGGIGFFYFSGHGVQVNKENYIIPITDALVYEDDAETEAVNVDMVAKEMENAENRLNILVLDACRNNNLRKRTKNAEKGLTEPTRKPEGTFIAFAAGDGQTASDNSQGRNGLFTQELLRNLEKPDVRLDDIFRTTRNEVKKLSNGKQVPMLSDSTSEAIFLKSTENVLNIPSIISENNAPLQISPVNKSVFDHYPRTTVLRWNSVPNAKSYKVQIDFLYKTDWACDVGSIECRTWSVNQTEFKFDFIGAQPGRWRVWAVYEDGKESPSSPWWEFEYKR